MAPNTLPAQAASTYSLRHGAYPRTIPLSLLSFLIGTMPVLNGGYSIGGFNCGQACPPPRRKRRKFKGWQRQLREQGKR